jgi:beta-N-acetylhexosaminidase
LRDVRPCGVILFARNVETQEQIKRLVGDARAAIGDAQVPVYIDQEGGRVQRIRPPLGRWLPPARAYGQIFGEGAPARAAVRLVSRLMAHDLKALGITANCVPVLDVPVPGAHDIIGNRAYGTSVAPIVALGGAAAEGHLAGGVLPVIKHVPGHGRALADSHLALPEVDASRVELEASDFAPFKALAHLPVGMTAHVVYRAIDRDAPASTSALVIRDVIRGHMGFDGLLMCDDLSMKALTGTMRARTRAVMAAGCDVALHCNGDAAEMADVAAEAPALSGVALRRYERALKSIAKVEPFDQDLAVALLAAMRSALEGNAAAIS